jgi:hypothetical protein
VTGRPNILPILLALGSGSLEAQAGTVVDPPWEEEFDAVQAAFFDRFSLA